MGYGGMRSSGQPEAIKQTLWALGQTEELEKTHL